MSEHTTETVIANQRETIRRLIEERDAWKNAATALYAALHVAINADDNIEQKGGA